MVPSYTVFRAGASVRGPKGTRFEPFTLSARVENLFDQYIFTSSSGTGSFDGSVTADYGRTILVTVEAKF